MSDGMIKGCTSPDGQYASGGGVRNSNQFTMTGGTIGDPDNQNDASSVYKLDIENPIIRINTAFKGCSSLEKISVLPRIYHN